MRDGIEVALLDGNDDLDVVYDTQVFDSTKNGGGHIKKGGAQPKASPKGVVSS